MVIVGDGLGAVAAAVTAGRYGARVVVLAPYGYLGGQAGPAGVSTMDEGGVPISGLYRELLDRIRLRYDAISSGWRDALPGEARKELEGGESEDEVTGRWTIPMNTCYYGQTIGAETNCPDPLTVHEVLSEMLTEAGVEVVAGVTAAEILQEGRRVFGVVGSDGVHYLGRVGCGDEFGDCYTLVDGLTYLEGNGTCYQHLTWATVLNWNPVPDPALAPPENLPETLAEVYSPKWVEARLAKFRKMTAVGGVTFDQIRFKWRVRPQHAFRFGDPGGNGEEGYRGMAETRVEVWRRPEAPVVTRTGLNYTNDIPVPVEAFSDPDVRARVFMEGQDTTFLYMWYLHHELGEEMWSVATDLGYETVRREFNNPSIPDAIESHFPPMPYVREGRRLAQTREVMTYVGILQRLRGVDRHSDSVMVGAYMVDQHGCGQPANEWSRYGIYDVPLGIFIPTEVDDFLPVLARGAGVDRAVSGSIRMQPTEIYGGQVVGTLLGLAAVGNTSPHLIDPERIRAELSDQGLIIDVPRAGDGAEEVAGAGAGVKTGDGAVRVGDRSGVWGPVG